MNTALLLTQIDTAGFELNKCSEILVSCSDKERNFMKAQGTACKLMDLALLHVSSCNSMKAYVISCKLI